MKIGEEIKVPSGPFEGQTAIIRDIKNSNIWLIVDYSKPAVCFDINEFPSLYKKGDCFNHDKMGAVKIISKSIDAGAYYVEDTSGNRFTLFEKDLKFSKNNNMKRGDIVTIPEGNHSGRKAKVTHVGEEYLLVDVLCEGENPGYNDQQIVKSMFQPTERIPIYMIYGGGDYMPKKIHKSYDEASGEMERLAKAQPGKKFYLLEAVEEFYYQQVLTATRNILSDN